MGFATGNAVVDGVGRSVVRIGEVATQTSYLDAKFRDMFVSRIQNIVVGGASR